MTGFDPYDPVDPMDQLNNDPLYPNSDPIPGDPMFKDQLRQASDQVLRRAKEQAIDPMIRSDVQQELWNRQAMRTEPPQPRQVTETVEKTSLSKGKKASLVLHILSTTVVPLGIADDYNSKCKYCDDEVRPFSEGPHHEGNCQRHTSILQYDTDLAHKKKCKHCDAQPFVAGFHHTKDCPRGFPALPMWNVSRSDYNNKCKNCSSEVRPFSEGPHHEENCQRHAPIPLFHTELAHRYKCQYCESRPFVAGPHHHKSCDRHVMEIGIPLGLLEP